MATIEGFQDSNVKIMIVYVNINFFVKIFYCIIISSSHLFNTFCVIGSLTIRATCAKKERKERSERKKNIFGFAINENIKLEARKIKQRAVLKSN